MIWTQFFSKKERVDKGYLTKGNYKRQNEKTNSVYTKGIIGLLLTIGPPPSHSSGRYGPPRKYGESIRPEWYTSYPVLVVDPSTLPQYSSYSPMNFSRPSSVVETTTVYWPLAPYFTSGMLLWNNIDVQNGGSTTLQSFSIRYPKNEKDSLILNSLNCRVGVPFLSWNRNRDPRWVPSRSGFLSVIHVCHYECRKTRLLTTTDGTCRWLTREPRPFLFSVSV